VSFLSRAGTRAAWYAEPYVVVTDLADGTELFREEVPAGTYHGHAPVMKGALSCDGSLLAYCSQPGEIVVREVADGRVRHTWSGDFALAAQLFFLPDGRRLVVQEAYGKWRWHCLDLVDGHGTEWPVPCGADRADLAVDARGGRLALARRDEMLVLNLATLDCLLRFPVEHVARRSAVTWVGSRIGVLTDTGCASLYAV
jgi:hypothetical protein